MNRDSVLRRNAGEIVVGALVIIALYVVSLRDYLLFHSIIELFTIIVASGIFVIAWNARGYIHNNYLLFLGIASLFIAFLDLLHTRAYDGMGVFPGDTANLATQLWIAGRLVQSVSWLVAPLFLGRKLKGGWQVGIYAIVTGLLVLSITYWGIFPTAYIPGSGLTEFKKLTEYVICLIFLAAIALLIWRRREFDRGVRRLLTLTLILSIFSEIAFTSYVSVYGGTNMLGHLLRLLAFYCLYKAVIETGLEEPYAILLRDLKSSDDQLREYAATLQAQNENLVRHEKQMREDALVLQTRNEELDAYAHSVAHDLKNPLAAIIAASDVITEVTDLTPKELREYLRGIKVTAFEMNDIIESLLLLAEVRRVDAPMEPVQMGHVIPKVRNRLKYLLRERRGRIVTPDQWPTAIGYEPWVEEVWANYISNAIKYGGVSPQIKVGATPQANGTIRFWTEDHGPGIQPEARATLFMPFTELSKHRRGGHGLGLSIVLSIVEKLGGEVGVESEVGKGSTFYFVLPAAPPDSEREPAKKQALPEAV